MVVLGSLSQIKPSPIPTNSSSSSSSSSSKLSQNSQKGFLRRRRAILLGSSSVVASLLHFCNPISSKPSSHLALALQQQQDEFQQEEDRAVHLFQESSPSVVFIKDLEIDKSLKESPDAVMRIEDGTTKVEGTGSGFIWDKFGHIVTNYHVVAKLATLVRTVWQYYTCIWESTTSRQSIRVVDAGLHKVLAWLAMKTAVGVPCVIVLLIYTWKRRHLSMYVRIEDFLRSHNNIIPIRYSYSDIKKMTNGFKDKLGEGGYRTVYKGKLRSDVPCRN